MQVSTYFSSDRAKGKLGYRRRAAICAIADAVAWFGAWVYSLARVLYMRTRRRGFGPAVGVALTSTIFALIDFSKVLSAAMLDRHHAF